MRRSFLFALCLGLSTLLAATTGYANGVFESVSGNVTAAMGTMTATTAVKNQRVMPGTTVTTGPGARTVIRFDDGHAVVLNENTEFRVNQYAFDKDKPQNDNVALQLLKGAMRSVSGLIGSRSRNAFALFAPQATIGIRGTDFMIALVNPAYLSVLQGTIAASNTAGTTTFAAGATATVASSAALAASIPAAALPASVASTFSSLGSVVVAAGAAGAGGAVSAGVGGITSGMIAAGVALIAVTAAAASSSESGVVSTTATTGTQP